MLLLVGIVLGVLLVLAVQYVILLNPFGPDEGDPGFQDQFPPFRIPKEIRQLLTGSGTEQLKKKEQCVSWNLLFQFLFQELKTSRRFRRWLLRRIQMELNDLTSRTGIGKLVQDIRIRDFAVGSQCPIIKEINVEKVELSEDGNYFEELDLILNIEYRGGFHMAVDVTAMLGRRAFLSVKVVKVAGTARLRLTRQPYTHWSFSFLQEPLMDFKVDSKFEGRPLAQLVPLIIQQFRRAVRRKHVLPQAKLRYRPFFSNPFLQPSPNHSDFDHIQVKGQKPFLGSNLESDHYVSLLLVLNRVSLSQNPGLRFSRIPPGEKAVGRFVQVESVAPDSPAERNGFRKGDIVLTLNNLLITSEKQATKVLVGTIGEVAVLVERKLENIDDEEEVSERVSSGMDSPKKHRMSLLRVEDFDGEFVNIDFDTGGITPSLSTNSLSGKSKSMTDLTKLGVESCQPPRTRKRSECSAPSREKKNGDTPSMSGSLTPPPLRKARSAAALQANFLAVKPEPRSSTPSKKSSLDPTSSQGDRGSLPSRPNSSLEEELLPPSTSSQPLQSSPSLSRRAKLLAKATEKGSQVATRWQVGHKWQIGKATVKGLWHKHRGAGPEYAESMGGSEAGDSDFEDINFPITPSIVEPLHSAPPPTKISNENSPKSSGQHSPVIPGSKSEESKLGLRIRGSKQSLNKEPAPANQSGSSDEVSTERARKRSFSEPDTALFSTELRENEEIFNGVTPDDLDGDTVSMRSSVSQIVPDTEKQETNANAPVKTPSLETEPTSPDISITSVDFMGGKKEKKQGKVAFEKRTSVLPLKKEVSWHQALRLPLEERAKYLTLTVWSCGERESNKSLMGYVNLYIPEVLDDCGITISNTHQQIFYLRPSAEASASALEKHHKESRLPGFDSRLCHGDLTLSFQWMPDKLYSDVPDQNDSLSSSQRAGRQGGAPLHMDSRTGESGHNWSNTHFQQAVFCGFCQRKIWLKTASQCLECLLICHKKCQPKANEVMACGGKPAISKDNLVDGESELIETGEDAVLEASGGSAENATGHLGKTRRLQMALSGKISNLRWRKPHGNPEGASSTGSGKDSEQTTQERVQEDTDLLYSNLLYTKGGTYNESVINAAKDLGKDLFVELSAEDRKKKINEQVERLQQEIDQVTRERLELLKKSKGSGSVETNEKVAKLDEKLQSLAVLMLHYCAGLQHCVELEDAKREAEASTPKRNDPAAADDQEIKSEDTVSIQSNRESVVSEEDEDDCGPFLDPEYQANIEDSFKIMDSKTGDHHFSDSSPTSSEHNHELLIKQPNLDRDKTS